MSNSFTRALSLSVRLVATSCAAALATTTLLAAPGCADRCYEYDHELGLQREASPTGETLRAVAVDSGGRFVAVGDAGTVLTREAVGEWQARVSGVAADLFGVAFASDGSRMIAVGAAGLVLISDDAGGTWSSVDTGVTTDLRAVHIFDETRAIAVGDGVALHSEDMGLTWTPAEVPATAKLRAVAALVSGGHRDLLAVGAAGVMLHSPDDGATWQLVESGRSEDLGAVTTAYSEAHDGDDWLVLAGSELLRGPSPGELQAEPLGAELLGLSLGGAWKAGADGAVRWTGPGDFEGDRELLEATDSDGARLLAIAGSGQGVAVGEGGVIVRADVLQHRTGERSWCEGRPFVVEEEARTAEATARGDWHDAIDVIRLPAPTRARLAAAWTRDGLYEHASIASFARFVLQLLAVGAPPDLVLAGQAALADEIRHAQACFGLASAFAGAAVGPGPLAIDGALAGPCDLATLASATAIEGCINETTAALMATTAANLAQDPAVHEQLTAIAADERRHAALAWRTVAWALSQGDARVRAAVAQAFAREPMTADEAGEDGLESHGRLSRRARRAVARKAWREIIAPHAAALLATPSADRSDSVPAPRFDEQLCAAAM